MITTEPGSTWANRNARSVDAVALAITLHSAPSKLRSVSLDSDLHHRLTQRISAADTGLRPAQDRLISLHCSAESIAAGTHHRSTIAVQHGLRRLLRPNPKHPLEAEGGDAVLLADHLPRRREPDRQRRTRSMEDRPRSG